MDLLEYRLRAHYGRLPRPRAQVVADEGPPSIVAEVGERAFVLTRAAPTTATTNPYFLGLEGRFVGAEQANRNNAFWSTADLQVGLPTVEHGPLNWLHDARRVVGSIQRAELVAATPITQPHIVAHSNLWRWIYPDEAKLVESSSERGTLWYSMECISREVACLAEDCGRTYAYLDTVTAKASCCSHIQERSAARRFIDPVFLGGAVIVPPVRPGWAESDLRVKAAAEELAATTAEVRGDASDEEWTAVMAQVLSA